MDEAVIEAAVTRAMEKALRAAPDPDALLTGLEAELPAMVSQLAPGTDDHTIARIVERCLSEATRLWRRNQRPAG